MLMNMPKTVYYVETISYDECRDRNCDSMPSKGLRLRLWW